MKIVKLNKWLWLLGLLLAIGGLAACQSTVQGPEPQATTVPSADTPTAEPQVTLAPEPTAIVSPTATAETTTAELGLLQVYENEMGGFSLMLPRDWTVSESQETPLGTQYLLGPAPLVQAGSANSTIIVADAAQTSPAQLGEQLLCGGGCEPPVMNQVVLRNGLSAQYALIGGEGAPQQPWYFVEHNGKLIAFSIHDPNQPEVSLDAIVHTLTFGPILETGGEEMSALQAARLALAEKLGLNPYAISMVSIESREWSDACLGVASPGQACAQVITPGYRVVLEAQGQEYIYHTNESGSQVREASSSAGDADELILSWHREGGIAGFCDDLLIYRSGVMTGSTCQVIPAADLGQQELSPDHLRQLNEWMATLQSFEMEQSDGAVADSMTIRLTFVGQGDRAATDEEKQAISAFASQLYGQLKAAPTS